MTDLTRLQWQFFERVIGRDAGGAGDEPPADGLIASGDLDIYARMYTSRLHDALVEDYPKLRVALGEDRFAELAARYVRAHPPWSFTLREYGVALAAFLRADATAPAWAADLAALERARVEVFDGPDAIPLAQADVAALGDQLPDLALAWVPSSVVVPLAWAVDDLWSAIEDDQPAFEPAPGPRVVLVWRREISVLHRTLDPDEGQLAPQLARGASFAEVCEVLGAAHGEHASSRAVELLLRWLQAAALGAPSGP